MHQTFKLGALIGRQRISSGGFYRIGVHRFALDAHFVMHMRTGGHSGLSYTRNDLALFNELSLFL